MSCCQGFGHLWEFGWWAACTASLCGCIHAHWLELPLWIQHVGMLLLVAGRVLALSAEVMWQTLMCLKHEPKQSTGELSHRCFLCRCGAYGHTSSTSPVTSWKKLRAEFLFLNHIWFCIWQMRLILLPWHCGIMLLSFRGDRKSLECQQYLNTCIVIAVIPPERQFTKGKSVRLKTLMWWLDKMYLKYIYILYLTI